MSYGRIYKITNKVNGKSYVGQTTKSSVQLRFVEHCNETRNNRHVSSAIRKYGKENFVVEEIATANSQDELNYLEVYFVDFYQTMYPTGYNHRAGGNQNGKCSDELKKKISEAKIGKPVFCRRGEVRSVEQKLKISRSLGGQRIIAVNKISGEIKIYETAHETKKDGFNPSNVVQICKKKTNRTQAKGFCFYYETDYVNQSGSLESNESKHAQRIEGETANAEYNPSTSHLPLPKLSA